MTIRLPKKLRQQTINTDDVVNFMHKVLRREQKIDRDKEHFWVLGLKVNNCAIYLELVSLGSFWSTLAEPMNVYRLAILKNAAKIIMMHNHPSGNLIPSEFDKDLTDRLIQAGRILNVEAIDHLIITEKSYFSFAKDGLFAKLERSVKWVPNYELTKRWKKQEDEWRKTVNKIQMEKEEAVERLKLENKIMLLLQTEDNLVMIEKEREKAEEKLEEERKKAEELVKQTEDKAEEKLEEERKKAKELVEEERKIAKELVEEERKKAEEKLEEERKKAEDKAKELVEEERKKAEDKAKELVEEERKKAKELVDEAVLAIAKKALKEGASVEMVSKMTGLTIEQIEKLSRE